MSILVTGGAGYIGSHTCVELLQAGYDVLVADNLSNSSFEAIKRAEKIAGKKIKFLQIDLCDYEKTEKLFEENSDIKSVIHFAGLKAVGESVKIPLEYYINNLTSTLNVLKCMEKYNVNNFVFSSSATVYGDPETVPISENFPLSATNPYGSTKLMIETILKDYCKSNSNLNVAILRYFNPIGAHESGLIGEDPNGIPNNLVPYVAQVAVGKLKEIKVFGNDYNTVDGTGVRDYIHVVDLAKGHIAALKKLDTDCGLFICNLGTGKGYSVLEVINAYSKACGKILPYSFAARREGDIAQCWADASKANEELDWQAKFDLEKMCIDSWKWQSTNPNGYSSSHQ
ncbi:MAG: UDP-glucose 4-epimerase GalE [Oscillospiraceae bacterium]